MDPAISLSHGPAIGADARARLRIAEAARATGLLAGAQEANAAMVRASSRLCLSVEHGDYNGTSLFGTGIDRFLWLACAANDLGVVRMFSTDMPNERVVSFVVPSSRRCATSCATGQVSTANA